MYSILPHAHSHLLNQHSQFLTKSKEANLAWLGEINWRNLTIYDLTPSLQAWAGEDQILDSLSNEQEMLFQSKERRKDENKLLGRKEEGKDWAIKHQASSYEETKHLWANAFHR